MTSSFFLSGKFSQHPLENYFGKQRMCGGYSELALNCATLILIMSVFFSGLFGNCCIVYCNR